MEREPEIEVEHMVPTERTLTGFYILLFCVIFVQILFFLFMENYNQPQPEPKAHKVIWNQKK